MANQIVVSAGAKVRNLDGVLTGTSGVVNSLPINASNGIPQLDVNGKILVSQLPNSVMEYQGVWNANTNNPTLTNGGAFNQGDVYLCNVAGTTNFGAGPISFIVGDQAIYSGTIWQKAGGATGTVTSVAITESGDSLNITGSPITTSGTINIGFNGTNLQYVNGAGNLTTFPTLITSIGLSMPSAFSVANSPLTANGTIAVTGAGTTAQYIRGDGSLATFPTIATEAQRLITEVYNETGATLTKGTVVYINGGHGNLPTITKAIATGDATSAQTYGIVQTDITNMNNGYVVVIGSLGDLDTQAYANGTQLYLSSTTAGAWTSTKQYAPAHLVYVAIVTRSHPTQGVVEVRIQNGFEMDELHNVSAQSPLNNQGLFYNTSTSLWENKSIATALGYTPISLTSLSASSPLSYNNTTGAFSIQVANTSQNGYLSSTDWNTFNGKENNLTFYSPLVKSGSSVTIPPATSIANGYLTSTDWSTFNNKQAALSGTGFVKISGTTISYDNSTYYLASNPSAFIALTALSAGVGISYNNTTGVITNSAPDQVVALTASTGISVTGTYPNFTITNTSPSSGGTVTSVAALTIGTTGTDLSSTVANSTTTPVITLNVPTASAVNRGALSSADWTTFNNKQSALTNPVTGTGTTNYLPKFTGTSTIGNSLISDDGTTVSIQRTAGDLELSLLAGSTTVAGNSILGLYAGTGAGNLVPYGTIKVSPDAAGNTRAAKMVFGVRQSGGALLDALTINSSGNLGLGVTPSAWGSAFKAIQVGGVGSIMSSDDTYFVSSNSYINASSNRTYITTGYALEQRMSAADGQFQWKVAPSGTAGAAITFTQAMTLTAAGNLGVGTASPSSNSKLAVSNGGANGFEIDVVGVSSELRSYNRNTSAYTALSTLASSFYFGTSGGGILSMDASGNTAIGYTTNPSLYKLDVNGTGRFSSQLFVSYSGAPDTLVVTSSGSANGIGLRNRVGDDYSFFNWRNNSGTELLAEQYLQRTAANTAIMRYTIANGGSPSTYLTIASTGAATFSSSIQSTSSLTTTNLGFTNTNASQAGFIANYTGTGALQVSFSTYNDTMNIYNETNAYAIVTFKPSSKAFIINPTNGGNVLIGTTTDATGKLQVNGTIYATGFYESSDIRFKNILETNPSVNVLGIDVIKFTRKDKDIDQVRYGYSAQQVQSILPDAVTGSEFLNVNYLDVHTLKIAQLEKEIKELKAKMN